MTEMLEARALLSGTVVATLANDANNDRKLDNNDPRLAGWTVFVDYNGNGNIDAGEPSALTNASGVATITGVTDGNWDIRQVMQSGFTTQTGFELADRERVRDNNTTSVTFLNVAAAATTGSIVGTVWEDKGQDGVRDPGDPGIAGWTIFLDINTNRVRDAGEPSTTTDVDGHYSFINLTEGRYRVREITPSGWDPTVGFDGAANVDVVAGATRVADFGNYNINGVGSIRGSLWNDVNADGARAASDPGLGDWTVWLDTNNNAARDAGEPTAITDAAGNFSFDSVTAGAYSVRLDLKSGWNASPGHPLVVTAVAANETAGIATFAVFTPTLGSVSGKVFNDPDGNGVQSAGEPGLKDWTVFIDADNDGTLGVGELSATTAADGSYTISGVPIGSFNVRQIAGGVGFSPTAPGTGVQLVRVLNGTAVSGVNFGNKQRTDGSIGGVAFFDADHDGVRDAGERGLPGLVVFLDLNDDGTLDAGEPSVVTSKDQFFTPSVNEAGSYQFTHLAAGTYHVRELLPAILSATPAAVQTRDVSLAVGEQRTGVNFADRYRANEIHGQVYDDQNKNHVRDPGEPGIAGVTVYIDLNRNNVADAGEPRSTTDSNGVYTFTTNLGPGSYVVRALHHSGREYTYPTTTSGILWPSGVSHPSVGNVTPGSITTSLAKDQTESHTVSLTLPTAGSITNKVDVFLLFDDTGSFTANSPIVRAAFPQIISTLQAAMPGVDFGFGVGRFEEYANFASEFSTGRPFILNQPILSADTPGFAAAIQSALDRTTPGYGGDQPETDIEALFQAATGLGFDGNNNGTTTDSGAAGLTSTQLTPGDSGDVPAFGSFTVDPSGNVLAASGSIGGAGFRPGALPIILTATDTGFAFQPKGEASITGVNGITLPISAFTQTSRPTTPFNNGAGIQETITALNALGALVIGLGTNGTANVDPRQGLEALATLTGATNNSVNTIANGTLDPIAPGDPFYFQISSGFGTTVTNGIVTAIENGVSNVNVNLTLKASDPSVHLNFVPTSVQNVGSGQTATFTVTFEGDGRPHRFDLQFVREGTDVVLGSIPVVIGTPIVGDGYDYVELEDGEIEIERDFGDSYNAALPTNVAPSFTEGGDLTVDGDGTTHTIVGWASHISAGPASDDGQLVDFVVSTNHDDLFDVLPSIAVDGTLTFTPKAGASGVVTISVQAHDTGGSVGGGQDTSAEQTFTITLNTIAPLQVVTDFDYSSRQALVVQLSQDAGAALAAGANLHVIDRATGLPVSLQPVSYDPATRRATVLFSSATLADGNYRLVIDSGAMPGLSEAYLFDFFVLAGDANHDRTVDFSDLLILAKNYGQPGKSFAQGDFDYSGSVDFNDLLTLAKHYNTTLAVPSAATAADRFATPVTRKRTAAMPSIIA